jgi:UDP-N-acetylmuramoylalanine--D-glutamate ligase
MKLSELKTKKVAIWGFGVEGKATAQYLSKHDIGFIILCTKNECVGDYSFDTTEVDQSKLNSFDCVIKSPGISPYTALVKQAKTQFISATALWFANEKNTFVIAITGTKGKSTTASLIAHILKSIGFSVNLVGNIGQALITSSNDYDYIVLEASSFQITDGNIYPDIALITNLFPEHVDWHNGFENYYQDKLKLFLRAKTWISNATNENLAHLNKKKEVVLFNSAQAFHVIGDELMFQQKELLNIKQTQLIGYHNLENMGAALSICRLLQLDIDQCIDAIKQFKPLQHRLQNLGKIGNHFAINDSIATTPIATLAAMKTVDLSNTTLLIGGYDRGNDWSEFIELINQNPPSLLLISGQNSKALLQHLQSINANFEYILCEDLKNAIHQAQLLTQTDGIILLSPGAPSFDQFESYIKRGEFFEQELRKHEN